MAENRELALILKLVADQFQSELKKSGGVVGEFQKFIGDWRTQLTAAATALFAVAKSTANYGDELVKMGQRLGITVEETARLQHAAKLSDTDLRGLSTTVGFLARNMLEASQGNREAQQGFAALGISVTQSNGQLKGTTDILIELSDKFRLMPDGPEKTALAMQTLGKSGKDVLPLLNSNLREAFQESDRLGLTMETKTAKAAEHFNDELTKLQGAIRGVTNDIGSALIPKFDAIAHALTTIITDAREAARALTGLNKIEAPQVGVVSPEGGGRRRLVMPEPAAESIKGFTTAPFFRTPEQAAADAEVERKRGEKQAQLARDLNEIWQTQNRTLEIRDKLFGEVMAKWEQRAQFFAQAEQREKDANERRAAGEQALREFAEAEFKRDDEMLAHAAATQERRGRLSVEQTQLEVRLSEEAAEASALANRTFFDEWKIGMDRYVRDSKSGFGLGADMARRTAQMMEQSFRTFFFDVWDGKIQSMRDVLEGLADFAKQVMGTVFSQLATRAVLGAFGFGAAGGGEVIRRFAAGGPVFGSGISDTVPALLTPGEFVLSRGDVHEIKNGLVGGGGVTIQINNYGDNEVQASPGERGPDGRQLIRITVRDMVRGMIQGGDMDRSMSQRFGLTPSPGRR